MKKVIIIFALLAPVFASAQTDFFTRNDTVFNKTDSCFAYDLKGVDRFTVHWDWFLVSNKKDLKHDMRISKKQSKVIFDGITVMEDSAAIDFLVYCLDSLFVTKPLDRAISIDDPFRDYVPGIPLTTADTLIPARKDTIEVVVGCPKIVQVVVPSGEKEWIQVLEIKRIEVERTSYETKYPTTDGCFYLVPIR